MRQFKFPSCIQKKLLPFFDMDTTPKHFQGDNIFALMFNQKLQSITLNSADFTITCTYQDGTKGLFIHSMSTDDFLTLQIRVINTMLLDVTVKGDKAFQENTIKNKKVGSIILPCDFHCVHEASTLTLTSKMHS